MASELLSSVTGGGGGFTTKFASGGLQVSTGATGTYITITPPSGQKVRLTLLTASAGVTTNLITVAVGGVDVIIGQRLRAGGQASQVGYISIGEENPQQSYITGEANEVFEISTDVATTQGTDYTYQFGV